MNKCQNIGKDYAKISSKISSGIRMILFWYAVSDVWIQLTLHRHLVLKSSYSDLYTIWRKYHNDITEKCKKTIICDHGSWNNDW